MGVLAAAAVGIYCNSLADGFAMDAPLLLLRNPALRQATADNVHTIFTNDYWYPIMTGGLYRPLTILSFLFNYSILGNGTNAMGYHAVNIALHAVNVWLVYGLAFFLLRRALAAFGAALLWAVHPIATETVANVAGRADLLATLLLLAALLLFLRGVSMRGWRVVLCAAGVFAAMFTGLLAKESAAVAIGLMLAWDVAYGFPRKDGGWISRAWLYGAAVACLALYTVVRLKVMADVNVPDRPFIDNPELAAGFWAARFTAIKVIGLELLLLILPLRLSSDYSYNQIPIADWTDWRAWLALAAVGGILYFAVRRRQQERLLFFLAWFFAITLLPTSNLPVLIGSIMAERFLYLPSIAFALALAVLAYRRLNGRTATLVVAGFAVLLAARTYLRNFDWKDNVTLAGADIHAVPDSVKVHKMYAAALFERSPREDLDLIIEEGKRSWEPLADFPDEHIPEEFPNNLGAYYREKGLRSGGKDTEEGRRWLQKALAMLSRARRISRVEERSHEEAEIARGRALAGRFGLYQTYLNLGLTYAALGDNVRALEALRYGRSIDPMAFEFYDVMASVYRQGGNPQWSDIVLYEKALLQAKDLTRVSKMPGAKDGCQALADLTNTFREARWRGDSRQLKSAALRLGCPGTLMEKALPEGPIF